MKILLTILFLLICSTAQAQNEQLWLARYCVNEAGFQIWDEEGAFIPFRETSIPDDCLAMHQSLVNNFDQLELRTWMMRRYGDNVFNRDRDTRRYIPFLQPYSRRPPRHWVDADWNYHGARFDEIYEYCGRILRGEVLAKCQPHHWGAPSLRRRTRRRGWIRLNCGRTRNDYWQVPRRL